MLLFIISIFSDQEYILKSDRNHNHISVVLIYNTGHAQGKLLNNYNENMHLKNV